MLKILPEGHHRVPQQFLLHFHHPIKQTHNTSTIYQSTSQARRCSQSTDVITAQRQHYSRWCQTSVTARH